MDAMVFSRHNQLRKHHSGFAVQCSVADVVLPRTTMRGVQDEIACGLIKGCGRGNRSNVGSVTCFGHRKTSRDFQRHNPWQPLRVMLLGP